MDKFGLPLRNTGTLGSSRELEDAQRSILRWLDDKGAAGSKARGDLPGSHKQWVVPGNDKA